MTSEEFVRGFVAGVRSKAAMLSAYGAADLAKACEQLATDLETEFRHWWLAELSIGAAADESGYSEERLREMTRTGELPRKKGSGRRGHLLIARCDLPRRPRSKADAISSLEHRLLRPKGGGLREPA